jgi:O-antigen/teichoic acid export membrane protein
MSKGLKTIACFKMLRGSFAFAGGAAIVIIYQTSNPLSWVEHPVFLAISSKDFFLKQFVDWLGPLTRQRALALGLLAISLGLLRYIEGIGLWNNKSWAQLTTVIHVFILLIFLINELLSKFGWALLTVALINIVILIYLLYHLHRNELNKPL